MIEIKNIHKVYATAKKKTLALSDISLDIADGEFISLLGPSGCGKSTLLMMCAGLVQPSQGSISIDGQEIREPQKNIGIVFQKPVLVDWRNIWNNIMLQIEMRSLNKKDYADVALDLLESVGLKEFQQSMPYELSGGMQQRASFCQALIHNPPLVLMDEPLGALDAMTRERLRDDLETLWLKTKKTFLFVTHDISEAIQLSDKIVVMTPRPGEINSIIHIDLPRPRGMIVRHNPKFLSYEDQITNIFQSYEVIA